MCISSLEALTTCPLMSWTMYFDSGAIQIKIGYFSRILAGYCWCLQYSYMLQQTVKKRKSYISLMIKSTYSTRKSTKYNLKSHTKWRVETFWIAHMIPLFPGGVGTLRPQGSLGVGQENRPLDPWENRPRWSLGLFGAWSEWSDASCTQLCVLDGTLARRSRGRWLRSGGMVGEGIHQKLLNCMNHWTIRVVYSRDKNCDFRFLKPEKKGWDVITPFFPFLGWCFKVFPFFF